MVNGMKTFTFAELEKYMNLEDYSILLIYDQF